MFMSGLCHAQGEEHTSAPELFHAVKLFRESHRYQVGGVCGCGWDSLVMQTIAISSLKNLLHEVELVCYHNQEKK